jgi:alkaline phosphatase
VARICSALLIAAMLMSIAPASATFAQDEESLPVLIFPVHRAHFLPGASFDIRAEVHTEERPEDFAVTINGEDVSDFFGVEATEESWQFSEEAGSEEELADVDPETIVTAHSLLWRDLALNEPGTYTVTVTAGGEETTAEWTVREPAESAGAQNVILFIADGGSAAVYTAARLLSRGMEQGTYGENLIFEDFEEIGFLHTSGIDSIITDSANSSSAYNTGHKTAVNANGVYPDTSYDKFDDPRTEKFAYLIDRLNDMSVGIVTNSNWSDATPNGVAGYGRDRSNEALNQYVVQPLDLELYPEVILGGGARNMLPMSVEGSRRDDERDVFADYEAAGYTVVTTASELNELVPAAAAVAMTPTMEITDTADMTPTVEMGEETDVDATAMEESIVTETEEITVTAELTASETVTEGVEATAELPERLLGIFHPHHMNVWLDRHVFTENVEEFPDQPDLDQMTLAALEVLGQNENGFYLMVEGSSIDKALHPMDFERALADMIEFERAVAATVEWVEENAPDTLIVVTSDHAHSYDVFGTVDTEIFNAAETDEERRSAIGIYSDAGFPTYEDADGDYFPDNWAPSIVLAQGKVDNPVFTEDFQVSEVYRTPSLREPVEDEDLPYESITLDNPEDDPNGLSLGGNLPEGSTSSVHTLQSVPIYAQGPGSDCFGRAMENIEVFFCMASAIGLNPVAE